VRIYDLVNKIKKGGIQTSHPLKDFTSFLCTFLVQKTIHYLYPEHKDNRPKP